MKPEIYNALFEQILTAPDNFPYSEQEIEYTRLNKSRQERWYKTLALLPELEELISQIQERQTWIVITEPWCGDSAHIFPFIDRLAQLNKNIELRMNLRDTKESIIDNYLINGKKSIPVFIVRDVNGQDLFTWGPRPENLTQMIQELKDQSVSVDKQKIEIQKWYNKDKGICVQSELLHLFRSI